MAATSHEKTPLLGSDHDSEDASTSDGSDVEASITQEEVGVLSASSIKEDPSDEPPPNEVKKKAFYEYLPGYGVFRLVKNASLYSLYVLMLLLAAYLLNQLNRYTLPVTTKAVAQDVHYGSQSCMISPAMESNGWVSKDELDHYTSICTNKDHK